MQWEIHKDVSMVEMLMYDSEHPEKPCENLNFSTEPKIRILVFERNKTEFLTTKHWLSLLKSTSFQKAIIDDRRQLKVHRGNFKLIGLILCKNSR